MSHARAKRIEDYALLADGETAALVHRNGSIEWMCMPRFDSEACFAALLGNDDNGCWKMETKAEVRASCRRYLGDTLILETELETEEGRVALIDFMPIRGQAADIVRIVEGREGRVTMRSELAPRFDYGQVHPLVRTCSEAQLLAIAGPDAIALHFDVPVRFEKRWFVSDFAVSEGERIAFVMTWFPSHEAVPERVHVERALEDTRNDWTAWIGNCTYRGEHAELVKRSLLTLRALIHRPTGGMVAAPTVGLPEQPGGTRNWDYRFCWLRDSTLMLLALLQAGMREEAEHWVGWLRRAVAGEPIDVQPFYTVTGDRRILEWEAPWLDGFNGAQPVRFGNAAARQVQLDVYGEVIETLHLAAGHGIDNSRDSDVLVRLLAAHLERHWEQPDAGIWESRGKPRHYVYSKVMCWVAFDRSASWFEDNDPALARHYRALADRVRQVVLDRGIDSNAGHFTGAFGERNLDAALLRLPAVGFIPADDPRMAATIEAIERKLLRDGLVRRYAPEEFDDGIGEDEGAFIAASFWLVDAYVLQGRTEEARQMFDRLCRAANDVGLLAEEYDGERLLGNFPQGLSHLSLIVAAMNLGGAGPDQERRRD